MKKVEETNKITKEQLEVITQHQKDLNKSLTNIGFLETQKHGLLHEYAGLVDDIEKYKVELEKEYELKEKYFDKSLTILDILNNIIR